MPKGKERKRIIRAPIITDPNGSYTGHPFIPDERPIQDVDDL